MQFRTTRMLRETAYHEGGEKLIVFIRAHMAYLTHIATEDERKLARIVVDITERVASAASSFGRATRRSP